MHTGKENLACPRKQLKVKAHSWYKQNKFIFLDNVRYKNNSFAMTYHRANVSVAQTMW